MDFEKQQHESAAHLGEALKAAREKNGLTVQDVANHLHLKQSFVNALESGDYQVIGSMVYVKGYLRIYTRLLQINLDEEVALLKLESPVPPKAQNQYARANSPDKGVKFKAKRLKRALGRKKYSVAFVVVFVLVVLYVFAKHSPDTKPALVVVNEAEQTHQALSLPPSTVPAAKPETRPSLRDNGATIEAKE